MGNSITVYQLDWAGVYVGTTIADESPLEPGKFHIPADCVTIAPPPPLAGKVCVFRDGTWNYVPTGMAPENIADPLPSFDDLRKYKIKQLNDQTQLLADTLTASYPPFERDTWPDQKTEALAWEADPDNAKTPCIDYLASCRNIDRTLYLQKTLAKVKAYQAAGLYLAGTRQRYEDQIGAVADGDVSALDAITFEFDIPTTF